MRYGSGFGKLSSQCFVLFVRRLHEASIPVWSSAHPSGCPTISVGTRLERNRIFEYWRHLNSGSCSVQSHNHHSDFSPLTGEAISKHICGPAMLAILAPSWPVSHLHWIMNKAPTLKQSRYCLQIDAAIQVTGETLPNPNCLDVLPWFGLKSTKFKCLCGAWCANPFFTKSCDCRIKAAKKLGCNK